MKLPKEVTEEEFLQAARRVMEIAKSKFKKNRFLDPDDLGQEAFLICSTAVFNYNDKKGKLEHFLCRSAINRIQNMIRDLTRSEHETETIHDCEEPVEKVCNMKTSRDEFFETMDESLPYKFREDYIKSLQGIKIPRVRKKNLVVKIKEVIDDCF